MLKDLEKKKNLRFSVLFPHYVDKMKLTWNSMSEHISCFKSQENPTGHHRLFSLTVETRPPAVWMPSCFLVSSLRPLLVRPLCWKQHGGGALSQQRDGPGAVCRTVPPDKWPPLLRFAKTNDPALPAVFTALRHFQTFLSTTVTIGSVLTDAQQYLTSPLGGAVLLAACDASRGLTVAST